jgi:putative DNA primase/helicase
VITQERVSPRRLGKSENVEVLCRAFMLANGKNIPIAADMARRVVVCSMDAKSERPELRDFRGDSGTTSSAAGLSPHARS